MVKLETNIGKASSMGLMAPFLAHLYHIFLVKTSESQFNSFPNFFGILLLLFKNQITASESFVHLFVIQYYVHDNSYKPMLSKPK